MALQQRDHHYQLWQHQQQVVEVEVVVQLLYAYLVRAIGQKVQGLQFGICQHQTYIISYSIFKLFLIN